MRELPPVANKIGVRRFEAILQMGREQCWSWIYSYLRESGYESMARTMPKPKELRKRMALP